MNGIKKFLRKVWAVVMHPAYTLDVLAYAWIRRRGYETVNAQALQASQRVLAEGYSYVERSGHLNTVSGRKPKAIERLKGYLSGGAFLATPDRPSIPLKGNG